MKLRDCVECGLEMTVPKTSGKRWCPNCMKKRRAGEAKIKYHQYIEDGRIDTYRETMRIKQASRCLNDAYRLVVRARARSYAKKVECTLTPEDLDIPEVCPVFKTPFQKGTEYAMSIDAINPKLGYTKENVQIISMKANAMKNSASQEELLLFAAWIKDE